MREKTPHIEVTAVDVGSVKLERITRWDAHGLYHVALKEKRYLSSKTGMFQV